MTMPARAAAAHVLDRFAYGPAPGEVDAVVALGPEAWLERQLTARERSPGLDRALAPLRSLELSNLDILRLYPSPGQARREAIDEGAVDPDLPEKEMREAVAAWLESQGLRSQRELYREALAARILRAALSANRVEEVMVDFWFDHFTVSGTDGQCRPFVGNYERDAIRANVFGRFGNLLEASAKHRAMLLYLDNAQSRAPVDARTTADLRREQLSAAGGPEAARWERIDRRMDGREDDRRDRMMERGAERGLNENYAREVLELHTLGVDGGYTQRDVEEVARALTGWTVLPAGKRGDNIRDRAGDPVFLAQGFVIEGDFLFDAAMHDAGPKEILGQRFSAGAGLDEGEDVLRILARHPSTAHFVSRKLAVRFVSDEPSDGLVDRLAEEFSRTDGDTRALLRAIVREPEFWESRREKIKSPFELAISGVRALDVEIHQPRYLIRWIDRMGQPIYRASAPTGFPDRAEAWVNAGALLHRMNFGLALGGGHVRGLSFDPDSFHDGLEPESGAAALREYGAQLLPARDLEETIASLEPLLGRPELAEEIEARAGNGPASGPGDEFGETEMETRPAAIHEATPAQVIGLLLGSPEFQRR